MELTKVKLSDVARVEISGVDKKSKTGQKSVRLCNFVDVYHNWAITQDMRDSFMEATASDKEIETLSIKKGQVAFTKDSETRDDIGIPTYIADDFDDVVLGYHNALITPDERKLNGKYLNAFMHSSYIQKYFENNASGSGQRYTLSNDTVNSIPILLPTIKEQEKIGNLFSFIDRKIALNKKMNQKLETMAKRLYDYWFVQYDFPDKNGHPYKTTGGPMTYTPTLKREIPEGWGVSSFSDFGFFKNGINYDKNEIGDETVKIVNVRNISDSTTYFNIDELDDITLKSDDIQKFVSTSKDILLARSGSPGATRLLPHTDKKIIYCGFIIRYQLNEQDLDKQLYLFHVLKGYEQVTSTQSAGSILKNISQDTLNSLTVVMPQSNVLDDFNKKIAPIYSMLRKNISELNKLTILRDKLLPLLMNGQVTVG